MKSADQKKELKRQAIEISKAPPPDGGPIKYYSLFPGFPNLTGEEKKRNQKELYWFLKEPQFNKNRSESIICPRCLFASGEFTGLNPDLIPIKKKWGVSFAACKLCKGNAWIDGDISNYYHSKFDENGHLKEWAKKFMDYSEIVRISKTRPSNYEFWSLQKNEQNETITKANMRQA